MPIFSRTPTPQPEPSETDKLSVDFAWKTHDAIQQWIRNVDQKASITFAIVVAVAGFAAAQIFGVDGTLRDPQGIELWAVRVCGVALVLAGASAFHAVLPSLKRRKARKTAKNGLIYFGHLRHRSAAEIDQALARLDHAAARAQLAAQLHITSDISWVKHARLQRAQALLAVGVTAFVLALLA
jgi:hypothetical protein